MKTRRYPNKNSFDFGILKSILFYSFVLLLPTQFGKHFFLSFSYLSGIRVDYLAPTIYLTDIIAILLIIFHIKTIFGFLRNKKILVLLSLFIVNIVVSLSYPLSSYYLFKYFEMICIGIIAYVHISNGKILLTAILSSSVIEFFLSILQLVYKHSLQGVFYFLGERAMTLSTPGVAKISISGMQLLRPYGTFSHPNSMAGFFLLIYVFVLGYKPFAKYLYLKYLVLFVTTFLVFISFSKIAIFTHVLLSVIFFLKSYKPCRICVISRILSLSIAALLFMLFQSDPLSISKRIELINNSLSIIISHPIFGVGIGNYLIAQNSYSSSMSFFFNQPVHTIFLLFLSENGIIITFYVSILLFILLKKHYSLLLFLIVAAIGITGSFDHYWLTIQQNILLMGFIVGIGMKAVKSSEVYS